MRIWFTEIGEPLPLEAEQRLHRVGNFSRYLASKGHDVTWWTSSFVHAGKKQLRERDCVESVAGVELRILKGPGYRRNISFARFAHQADFARRFVEAAEGVENPDIIVSPIPTLEVGSAAVRFARKHGIPIVTDIRDEWPEDFARLAPKPFRWAARLVLSKYYTMARYICSEAQGIMGISERQLSYGLEMAGRARRPSDGVFPLGYSAVPVSPTLLAEAKTWWQKQGIDGSRFTIAFFGTIGEFFDLGTVIEAARKLEKEFPLHVVLCGDGGRLEQYRVQATDVKSVVFPGWIDAPRIAALMSMAHVGLAPYAADAVSMALPNKPFEYMAGGLALVSSLQGELRRLLEEYDCGITYAADSVSQLVEALRTLHTDRGHARRMGANARGLLETRFTHERIHEQMEGHLLGLARKH